MILYIIWYNKALDCLLSDGRRCNSAGCRFLACGVSKSGAVSSRFVDPLSSVYPQHPTPRINALILEFVQIAQRTDLFFVTFVKLNKSTCFFGSGMVC